jgi:tryptophanase
MNQKNDDNKADKSELKKYISYFQETNSYGVMTIARTSEEAAKKAAKELKDTVSRKIYLHKIPLTHVQTEEWNPDIDIEVDADIDNSGDIPYLKYVIEPNSNFSQLVSDYSGKELEELTDKDFEDFFMDCTNEFIEKGTKWVEKSTAKRLDRIEEKVEA